MEKIYIAYEKTINGAVFYFVKQYRTFPEYKNIDPVLENYGMHNDFKKACEIAMLKNSALQQKLLQDSGLENPQVNQVHKQDAKSEIYSYKLKSMNFPFLLKLIRLR